MDSVQLKLEIVKVVDQFLEGAILAEEAYHKIGSLLFEFEHACHATWIEQGGSIGKNDE